MDVYSTEEEQLEALRRWWKENGKSAILGVVLGLGGVLGWRTWQSHEVARGEIASALYEQALDSLTKSDTDAAKRTAGEIEARFGRTAYAIFARMIQAKIAVEANDLDAAASNLEAALKLDTDSALSTEISYRYARVLAAQGKYPEALAQLDHGDPGEFASAYDELRGDIAVKQGDTTAARTAYERARNSIPAGEPKNELLELKLNDLGQPASP